jgi:YVTN family beta-propeller protein
VEIRDSAGASLIIEREVTVVRLGNQPFLEEVDFSNTGAQVLGGFTLFLEKIRIRVSGSTETQEVSASFSWQESCQCFVPQSLCGNGGIEPGEECDGATLGGESCTTLGFSGGTLSCSDFCTFETNACTGGPALYVTNVRGNSVSVIDPATNEVTKTISVGRAPRGIAFSPDGATAYVTNSEDDNVSLIDTTSNTVSGKVAVGKFPQGIAVTPDGTKVYVVNGKGNSLTVLNSATKQAIATVPVGNEPQAIALAPDGKTAYVTNFPDNTVSVVNTTTDTEVGSVDLGTKKGPDGIAVTPDGKRVFVVNYRNDSFSILDASVNPVVVLGDPVPFGFQPVKVAISADGTRAYISSVLDSTIGVFDITGGEVEEIGSIFTSPEPEGIALFPLARRLYGVAFGESGEGHRLNVVSTVSNDVITTIDVGKGPFAVALKPTPPSP